MKVRAFQVFSRHTESYLAKDGKLNCSETLREVSVQTLEDHHPMGSEALVVHTTNNAYCRDVVQESLHTNS